jgi:hypothetical protein
MCVFSWRLNADLRKARVIKNRELFDGQTICKATFVDIHRCQNVADAGSEEDTCRTHRQTLKRSEGATRQKAFSMSLDSR